VPHELATDGSALANKWNFGLGALAFLIVVTIGWPQLSKFQRGQQIEIGSAKLPLG
jgi:hypothetical protein